MHTTHQLRQAEETIRLRDRALEAINQGIFITDPARPDEPIIYVNAAFEVLPEPLDRVQLWAIGGQPHQDNVLRDCDALRDMRRGLV